MGALYNAKFSGSPIILTAGQQEQGHGLLEPLLYEPLVPIAQPMVKWAVDVTRAEDMPRILHRAAKVALTPPTGPVFISLPGDVLEQAVELDMGRPVRVDAATRPSDATLARLAEMLLASNHPVIIAGQELATHDAFAEAAELAELLGAAVYQSSVAYSAQFPTEHPACMGSFTRSQKQVRSLLEPYPCSASCRSAVHSIQPDGAASRILPGSTSPSALGNWARTTAPTWPCRQT
jgi:benzoylformate decarboxylase